MTALFNTPALAQALLQFAADELFVFDIHTLDLLQVSDRVLQHTGLSLAELKKLSLTDLLGVDAHQLADWVTHIGAQPKSIPDKGFKLLKIADALQAMLLVCRSASAEQRASEYSQDSRVDLPVSNTPGLVFEFRLNKNHELAFGYLSEGCKALLGMDAEVLRASPKKFYQIINAEDRQLLRVSLRQSAATLKVFNWEGRVWIQDWNDTKWINIRATPRTLSSGGVQWDGIMTNITQSKLEKIELAESRRRLADLSAHMERVKEAERARISREIHDDLGGNLTAIKIALSSITKRLPSDQPTLLERAAHLEAIVDSTFEAAHRIAGDLRPTVLSLGISAALEWQAKEFEKRMEIPCQLSTNMAESNETQEQATALFRICQEALSNIAKYAQASHVDIVLWLTQNDIKMGVTDDGVGIELANQFKPNSFGLRGMQERAAALGGSLTIERGGDRGTAITVILPREARNKSP